MEDKRANSLWGNPSQPPQQPRPQPPQQPRPQPPQQPAPAPTRRSPAPQGFGRQEYAPHYPQQPQQQQQPAPAPQPQEAEPEADYYAGADGNVYAAPYTAYTYDPEPEPDPVPEADPEPLAEAEALADSASPYSLSLAHQPPPPPQPQHQNAFAYADAGAQQQQHQSHHHQQQQPQHTPSQPPPPSGMDLVPQEDMGDLAQLMSNYREASRHLWNAHFRPVLTTRNAALLLRRFKEVRAQMFDCLVLDGMRAMLPILRYYNNLEAYIQITIRPSEACPILIGRVRGKDGYWDHPVDTTDGSDIYLRFIDFFDWDELGPRDMTYYKCEILDFPSQNHLRGHYALLLVDYGVPAINLDALMENVV